MATTYNDWNATTTYSTGDKVRFDGIIYRATASIAAEGMNPSLNDAWVTAGIYRIQSYHSLIAAIRLEINVPEDDETNDTICRFIQEAEESFQTRIRAPIQRQTRILTVDANSRVEIPQDLLQVINLRINIDSGQASSLMSRGRTEILSLIHI